MWIDLKNMLNEKTSNKYLVYDSIFVAQEQAKPSIS